jgi:signal transduction histidine kinase
MGRRHRESGGDVLLFNTKGEGAYRLTAPLRILHLEDDPVDAKFIKATIEGEGVDCDILRVETRDDFTSALDRCEFDIVFSDYLLPGFDGLSALSIAKGKCPSIPFIFISGNMGEDLAIETLKSGATDYVIKNRLSRLIPSLTRALQEATERAERLKAMTDLTKSHEQLRLLAAHLQSVREDERTNIAREIHDELGQNLTASTIELSRIAANLSKKPGNEVIAKQLTAAIGFVSSTIGTVKQICTNLRPPLLDHLGIGAAIEWQCEEFQKRSGVECEVAIASDIFTVNMDVANALFRIFQEALTNVLKHSQATKVEASLKEEDGNVVLEIHDNGVGITENQMSKRHSFGLLGMRERLYPLGGTVSINGKDQGGTILTVSIPVLGTGTKS